MYLENLVFDAVDPQRLGRFWEAALGCETLTDEPAVYETRLIVDGGPTLDLCFQRVPEPPTDTVRLHLDLAGGMRQQEVVERLTRLGARPADIGQGDGADGVAWVVLADPEGNAFCVMEERPSYTGREPLAALPLDSADPARDLEFWAWLSGWDAATPDTPTAPLPALQHPSGRGPLLEFCPEPQPKVADAKNRLHLDLRLESGDDLDAIAADIVARGGSRLVTDWGELPWQSFRDPSGNEFCLLPARSAQA